MMLTTKMTMIILFHFKVSSIRGNYWDRFIYSINKIDMTFDNVYNISRVNGIYIANNFNYIIDAVSINRGSLITLKVNTMLVC